MILPIMILDNMYVIDHMEEKGLKYSLFGVAFKIGLYGSGPEIPGTNYS